MIRVKNLHKWYGKKHVLRGLNLKVDEGEIFGLLGPNGAGKTTLIKILTGQTDARGTVRVAGVNPLKNPIEVRKKVGIVPESESVPNYLTVEEYLYFVTKVRNIPAEKAEESIKKYDLEEYREVVCKDLSKGTKQRLIFSAAMIHDPKLLFLDEPFINLDPIYQRKITAVLREHVEQGNTIFMATHIMEIAVKLCNRVGIIKDGKIVKIVEDLEDLESTFLEVVGYAEVLPD
ncbi:MAG: ABC transporter ATP-binding protein [Euryarchaeota archaeon]|nr:ABC transporter ATP-binding protein [Euryarchaeota archaeon]